MMGEKIAAEEKGPTMRLRNEFDSLVSEHIEGKPSVHSTQRLDEHMSWPMLEVATST